MSDPVEILNSKIATEKEILSVMPKNTKKNLALYKQKVEEKIEEYNRYLNDVILEIKRRANRINNIKENAEIKKIQNSFDEFGELDLFDSVDTSFEKMQLDVTLFGLRKFYKNNLEKVNNNIVDCIQKFEQVGIQLTEEDFNYCPFVKRYMQKFFVEYEKGNVNSQEMKDTFEKIYWECSDLIMHIELNIRYIYLKKQKEIDKNLSNSRKEQLKKLEVSEDEYFEKYKQLKQELDELKAVDKRVFLDKFINKELDVKEYEDSAIERQYSKMLAEPFETYSKTELNEIKEHILKLSKSIEEYKNYAEYKFVVDEVLKVYEKKENYKNVYEQQKKEIQKLEAKLEKTNKKYDKAYKHKDSIFFRRKSEERLKAISTDINTQILKLKEIYRQLDIDKANEKIVTTLTDNSTIYDAMFLASAYYTFLVEIIIQEFEGISEDEINNKIREIRNFVTSPYIAILNNVTIKEEKDIVLMIKDKYNLFNINISKEDFEEGAIDTLIETVNFITNKCYLEKSRLDLEDVSYIIKANQLLEELK